MTLEQFLGNRYQLTARLPALGTTHQRYLVVPTNGTNEQLVLSYADYSRPISMESLGKQRRISEVMMRPSVGLLCRVTDFDLKADYQWSVSEYAGDFSLRELLQQRQSLSMEEVEAFLRLLTEACEAAAAGGWPRLQLDAAQLFLDPRLGLPRIPAPDIPAFDAAGIDAGEVDPMATMQFNAADLRAALMDPVPKDTHDYVLPLAALACDLLGQPQHLRGGNARYQPVPQLTSQQNVLLRRALTSEGRAGFATAKGFMDEFFGISVSHQIAAHTERLKTLTSHSQRSAAASAPPPLPGQVPPAVRPPQMPVSPPAFPAAYSPPAPPPLPEPASHLSALDSTMGLSMMVTQPVAPPKPKPVPSGPRTAMLSASALDRALAESAPPVVRVRLVPDSEEAPIFALVGEEHIVLGRSAADADFIAQFRPRSNMNDARSRRISRAQTRGHIQNGKLKLEETDAVNPSVMQDAPIPGYVEVNLPMNFLLAGEYPVEIRAIGSDYPEGREVQGWTDPALPADGKLRGAAILRPGGSGVMMCEAAVLFSDLGIHFSKSGRPWMRADAAAMPVARLHRFAGHFWIEPLEASVVAVASGSEVRSKAHELILLTEGSKVRLGPYGYTVQYYNLPASASQSG